jgi:hypothetical protein
MHPGRAFVAGIVGALAMSLVMVGVRAAGIPLHIESQLAAVLGTNVWMVGFAAHLSIGGALGIAYGMAFELVLHQSGVGPGLILGAYNTIFAGFVWAALGGPGHFWSAVGPQGIIALFLAHMTFGAVVGAAFKAEETLLAPTPRVRGLSRMP